MEQKKPASSSLPDSIPHSKEALQHYDDMKKQGVKNSLIEYLSDASTPLKYILPVLLFHTKKTTPLVDLQKIFEIFLQKNVEKSQKQEYIFALLNSVNSVIGCGAKFTATETYPKGFFGQHLFIDTYLNGVPITRQTPGFEQAITSITELKEYLAQKAIDAKKIEKFLEDCEAILDKAKTPVTENYSEHEDPYSEDEEDPYSEDESEEYQEFCRRVAESEKKQAFLGKEYRPKTRSPEDINYYQKESMARIIALLEAQAVDTDETSNFTEHGFTTNQRVIISEIYRVLQAYHPNNLQNKAEEGSVTLRTFRK